MSLHATRHDLSIDTRKRMVEVLNPILADLIDLHAQIKQAHWNIQGPHFAALHELFDAVAAAVFPAVDEVAERITALGGTAAGELRQVVAASRLAAFPSTAGNHAAYLPVVAERLATVAATTRSGIATAAEADDDGTADLLTGLVRELDKQLWFVESHTR